MAPTTHGWPKCSEVDFSNPNDSRTPLASQQLPQAFAAQTTLEYIFWLVVLIMGLSCPGTSGM